jgi:hypothetical protein
VDGTVPYQGRVEFCKSGWWSTICSYRYYYYWDNSTIGTIGTILMQQLCATS